MKRIRYGGHTLVTGSATADAFVRYAAGALARGRAVRVDLHVLEESGRVWPHTVLFGPAAAFDVADVDGSEAADEAEVFPLPEFPRLDATGTALPPEEVVDLAWGEMAERPV